MSNNLRIYPGDEVKDMVTGFTGIAMTRAVFHFGCVRIEVQPQKLDNDKNIKEPQYFDEAQLTVVKSGKIRGDNLTIPSGYELGDEMVDVVTGFKGVATNYLETLCGPVKICIQPQGVDKDGKPLGDRYFLVTQLLMSKKAKLKPVVKPEAKKKSTGGPKRNDLSYLAR